ncbi:MAG: hypothetical protein E6J75_14830, partial [Deltaproteobacteria bacterium]
MPRRGRRGRGGGDRARAPRGPAAPHPQPAASRSGVGRPGPRARGGPPGVARCRGELVLWLRRTQREPRARAGSVVSVDVAVTGLGVLSAFGAGVDRFWRALVAGESGLGPLRRFAAPPGAAPVAEVPAVEARDHVRSPLGRRIDRVSLLTLAACRLALQDASLDAASLPRARTGLAVGSEFGNLDETATFLDRLFARGAANPL